MHIHAYIKAAGYANKLLACLQHYRNPAV